MDIEIRDLCEGLPERIQQKIRAAYWLGCAEGMAYANSNERKIDRRENNVVYLKQEKEQPTVWNPPEL